jgi:hypothetical protein
VHYGTRVAELIPRLQERFDPLRENLLAVVSLPPDFEAGRSTPYEPFRKSRFVLRQLGNG